MAQVEFTGKTMTFVFDSKTLGGLQRVEINEDNGDTPESLDVTVYGDATYTYLADPLGAKGSEKVTVTVVLQDSTQSVDDALQTTIAFNTAATATFCSEPGTANTNQWDHAALSLTKRVTEIPYDAIATCTLTFEANSLGTWSGPA